MEPRPRHKATDSLPSHGYLLAGPVSTCYHFFSKSAKYTVQCNYFYVMKIRISGRVSRGTLEKNHNLFDRIKPPMISCSHCHFNLITLDELCFVCSTPRVHPFHLYPSSAILNTSMQIGFIRYHRCEARVVNVVDNQ